MTNRDDIEVIARHHEGADHLPQPCKVGEFACDVHVLITRIRELEAEVEMRTAIDLHAARRLA